MDPLEIGLGLCPIRTSNKNITVDFLVASATCKPRERIVTRT